MTFISIILTYKTAIEVAVHLLLLALIILSHYH